MNTLKLVAALLLSACIASAANVSSSNGTYFITGKTGYTKGSYNRSTNLWRYDYYANIDTSGGGSGSNNGGVGIQMGSNDAGTNGAAGTAISGGFTFSPGAVVAWGSYAQAYTAPSRTYSSSGTFTVPPAPPVAKTGNVSWENTSPFTVMVTYRNSISGNAAYTKTVAPGENLFASLTSDNGGDLVPTMTAIGVAGALDGAGDLVAGTGTYEWSGDFMPYANMTELTASGTTTGAVLEMNQTSDALKPHNYIDAGVQFGQNSGDAYRPAGIFNGTELASTGALTQGQYYDGVNRGSGVVKAELRTLGDRIVAKIGSSGGGGTGGNTTVDYSAITGNKTLANLYNVLTGAGGRDTAGESATATAFNSAVASSTGTLASGMPAIVASSPTTVSHSDDFSFIGDFDIMGVTFAMKPYAFATNLATLAPWIYELQLLAIAVAVVLFTNAKAEQYFQIWWSTPQAQTKVEPTQLFVPAVGWGKQLGMTVSLITGLGVAVAATIVFMNTIVGPYWLPLGVTTTHVAAASHTWSVLADFGAFIGPIWGELNRWVPVAAYVQAQVSCLAISWGMPTVWLVALSTVKYFQI